MARRVGVSERAVYGWIAAGQLDREVDGEPVGYGPRRRQSWKLDPYKEIIEAHLAEYPELSAVRLFREVRAAASARAREDWYILYASVIRASAKRIRSTACCTCSFSA